MNKSIIELNGVTVRKPKGLLLDGINLSVSHKEFVGIIKINYFPYPCAGTCESLLLF